MILQIFACLESNIPHNYSFNDNTQLLVLDVENNSRKFVDNIHPLVQNILNNTNHLNHGKILHDYINHKLDDHIITYENLDTVIQQLQEEEEVVEEKVEDVVEEVEIIEKVEKVEEIVEKPKKKRGRPKKVVEEVEKPKKKRGRPKKVIE